MQGFFASLRFAGSVRGLLAGAATAPALPATPSPRPFAAATAAGAAAATSVAARPVAQAATPAVEAAPAEPAVLVAAKHLVDPVGLRVVPFRPSSRWPLRRAAPRVLDPFRGFPQRSRILGDLMYASHRRR